MPTEHLTECERIVMKCVWDAGKNVSLVELMDSLKNNFGKDWKRQTVSTFLLHLIQKGFLSSYRVGRVFYYTPLVELEPYKKQLTEDFIRFWYGKDINSLESLIKNM